ncbi:MAG: hypothetical protein AMJ66_09595 [Betaproteobacteria bacterium SG8_40]|nr:MAG: hypothetical protein AMJ66_09595 [Betaproteobacteria bacterium SG8_40]
MNGYLVLKGLHVSAVALSGIFFLLRGVWMLRGSALLQHSWVRITPHVVDTVLLAAALGLLVRLQLNPFATPWLGAKLIALAGYIVFGSFALKRGRTRRTRSIALLAALGLFAYMIGTALTRDPFFFLPG